VDKDDLTQLREQHPDWRFGTTWITCASGPDKRLLWAYKDGERLLTGWEPADLAQKITAQ
jgi:hypothetical protein